MADAFIQEEGSLVVDGTEQVKLPVKYIRNNDGSYSPVVQVAGAVSVNTNSLAWSNATYIANTNGTGYSTGDDITATLWYDVSNPLAPAFVSAVFYNWNTAAAIVNPNMSHLNQVQQDALTDTQLRASALAVSLASVPSHAVTNAGTFPVQAAQSGTWNTTLLAGTALVGKFGIDQTTPFVTNAVSLVNRVAKTDKSGTITAGGSAQTLMAANSSRLGWQIRNISNGRLWINELGNAAIQDQPSLLLEPGDYYSEKGDAVSVAAISIIGATTGQAFVAREW